MNAKHWVGLALMVWGGVGVVNQFFMMSATAGSPAPTASLNSFDPATVLQIANPAGASFTSPAMLTDAAIAGVGAWLYFGAGGIKKLV